MDPFKKEHLSFFESSDVLAIYLFGSRAVEGAHELSDYDYAILTKDNHHKKGDELYESLYDIFCEVSPRTLKNDVIDIVYLKQVGLELRYHVIRHGKVLYDKDPVARLDYEAQTMLFYCDYRPILDEFDEAILESL